MTLRDRLLARLAEIAEAASGTSPAPWTYGDIDSVAGGSLYDPTVMIASVDWDNDDPRPVHRRRTVEEADANGHFIALARSVVGPLAEGVAEEVRRQHTERVTTPRGWIDGCETCGTGGAARPTCPFVLRWAERLGVEG